MAKLTVSIVNFNSGDFLINCLNCLEKVKDETNMEIYVVDNASSDDSFKKARNIFSSVNFLENKENIGFSRAQNQILKKADSEYLLILNPDTEVLGGVLKYLISFMDENTDVGVTSPKVELESDQIDWASHRGFPTPLASFLYYFLKNDSLYHQTGSDLMKSHEVDAISGAFFLVRKSVLEKVGYFDEDYFMYGEDLDLCYRIKKAGFKIMYLPSVKIVHHKGVSSGLKRHSQYLTTADEETRLRALNAFYNAMKIFYKKNLEENYLFFINWLVYLGISVKWWLAKRGMTV